MTVKVLGSGCANCKKLEKLAIKAMKEIGNEVTIEKVADYQVILSEYNVMTTPALVVDEEVLIKGRVPSYKEILEIFKGK